MKSLLNNKKIPCIPPLFQQNKYVTDFKKKTEFFNCFFAKQCSIINNSSELPFNLCKKIDEFISTVAFTSDDIATLIQNLDPNKFHGQDMLSTRMSKLCNKSICKPLDLYFNLVKNTESFLLNGKKQMLFLSIKKVTNRF